MERGSELRPQATESDGSGGDGDSGAPAIPEETEHWGSAAVEAHIFLMDEDGELLAVVQQPFDGQAGLMSVLRHALGGPVVCIEAWSRGARVARLNRPRSPSD